jgi:fructosamine-3-kinase
MRAGWSPTDFELPPLAPFVRLSERINGATTLSDDARAWLRRRLDDLQEAFDDLPTGLPKGPIHGDAWAGNVVVTADSPVLLYLERCSVGPPEWDLVSTAVRYSTFGTMTATEYDDFAAHMGTT